MLIGRAQDKAILNLLADNKITAGTKTSKKNLRAVLNQVVLETKAILEDDQIANLH